jgi:hypothetical protein
MKNSFENNIHKKTWSKPCIQVIDFHQTESKGPGATEMLVMGPVS